MKVIYLTLASISHAARDSASSHTFLQHLIHPLLMFLVNLRLRYRAGYKPAIEVVEAGAESPASVEIIFQTLKLCPHACLWSISPVLEDFHIHSSLLSHFPLFSWTLEMLNTAPIKCLSFSDVELNLHDGAYILASNYPHTKKSVSLTLTCSNHVAGSSPFPTTLSFHNCPWPCEAPRHWRPN